MVPVPVHPVQMVQGMELDLEWEMDQRDPIVEVRTEMELKS